MNKRMLSISGVVTFLTGFLVGLLAAPRSGKESRDAIKRRAKEGLGTLQHKTKEAADKAQSGAERAGDETKNTLRGF